MKPPSILSCAHPQPQPPMSLTATFPMKPLLLTSSPHFCHDHSAGQGMNKLIQPFMPFSTAKDTSLGGQLHWPVSLVRWPTHMRRPLPILYIIFLIFSFTSLVLETVLMVSNASSRKHEVVLQCCFHFHHLYHKVTWALNVHHMVL